MKIVKLASILSVAMLVAACGPTTTTAVVTVEKPKITVPEVDNIKLRDIEWHVIGRNNAQTAFDRTNSQSLFAITPKGYENLSLNTAQMTRTIRQLQAQVKAYKEYYETKPTQQGKK